MTDGRGERVEYAVQCGDGEFRDDERSEDRAFIEGRLQRYFRGVQSCGPHRIVQRQVTEWSPPPAAAVPGGAEQ